MKETRRHADVDQYLSAVVREGLYSTERNLRFYLKTLLGNIDFYNKTLLDVGGATACTAFTRLARAQQKWFAWSLRPREAEPV